MTTTLAVLVIVVFAAVLAILVASPILLPIILRKLADRSYIFARGNEGDYRAVIRNGAFRKGVVIYRGFHEDGNGDIVERKETAFSPIRRWLEKKLGGIFSLWIPGVDEVYRYTFRWNKLSKVRPKGTEDGYVTHAELPNGQFAISFEKGLDYIYLRDANYFLLLKEAETKDLVEGERVGINLSIYAVVTLRITNPYRALFRVDNWLDVTLIAIESSLRSWASRTSYAEILKKKEVLEHNADDEFLKTLTEKGMQLTDYVTSRYGAQIKRIQFIEIDLPPAVTEQINAAEAAKKEAERIETLATARGNQIEKTYDPVIKRGEVGLAIRSLESVDNAGKNPANHIIFAGPGLVQGLSDLAAGVKAKKGDTP